MAKGTTTEYGLVGSYFANPFGPVQRKEQTEPLLQEFFHKMFEQGVQVGVLRTRLGIKGQEYDGPRTAAKTILHFKIILEVFFYTKIDEFDYSLYEYAYSYVTILTRRLKYG